MKNFTHIQGDIYGGIVSGIVALPLALAFGVQSGLGASAGLYGAIALGLIAAIFGGTPSQVSGPTGPMTVVSSLIVATAINYYGGISSGLGLILTIFFLAGCFQILLGILKVGNYVKYIPRPVISGFMSGVGIIIILFQIYPLLGHVSPSSTIKILEQSPSIINQINYFSLLLGLITLLLIYLFKPWNKYIPSIMVALLFSTLFANFFHLDIPLIGELPKGIQFPDFSALFSFKIEHAMFVFLSALTLAGLGAVDSLLTSVIADQLTFTHHQSNKELVGQGIGNIAASLVGGLPGAGATMRTVANIKAGGSTPLSGIIHSLLLFFILFGLGKYISQIPLVSLAGILVYIGLNIIDFKSLKIALQLPRTDMVVMITVLILTVFANLLDAIAAGMILSSFFFMKKLYEISIEKTISNSLVELLQDTSEKEFDIKIDLPKENVYVKVLHGPLFLGVSKNFYALLSSDREIKHILLHMGSITYLDQSGIFALKETFDLFERFKVNTYIISLQKQPEQLLKETKFIPKYIPLNRVFNSYRDFLNNFSYK